MKRILFIIGLLFFALISKGQVYQLMPQYGYDAKRMKFDSTLSIPTVCGVPTIKSNIIKYGAIAFDSCNKRFYAYDPKDSSWNIVGGAGADSTTFYTKYRSDTSRTNIYSAISQKVDSVKRVYDSVKYYKNGTGYFAFRDSVQNGRWGNDTALVILAKVHNSTGTTLTRGTAVMISGAVGDVAAVIRANNKYDSTSARTIGLVKDPISAGDTGYVVTQGQASKLDLGAFTAGDVLYLDSIDGGLTKTKPIAPYHQVFVCIVERANNGNGLAYVKPQNGQEIEELHDVRIITPLNNQILVYSDTQQLWKNRNVYSIVDTTSLSNRINNVVQDITVQPPLNTSGGTNPDITIDLANAVTDGYLSAFDYQVFSGKVNASDTSAMLTNYQRTSAFPIATFGAGSGAAGDTSAFTTSAIYGSFYLNAGSDTIIVTGYTGVVQGTSASVTPTIYFNDTLNVAGTKIVNSPSAVTSTTTGNTVTSLDNTKIPPGNFVWVKTETVTTKPTYFNLTLIGYRKR